MDLGIVHGLSMEEYRAHSAVAVSDLKNIERSPAYAQLCREEPQPQTPAMAFGTAVHTAVLEPDHFGARYAIDPTHPEKGGYPRGWRNTKEYRQQVEFLAERGVELLTQEQMDQCRQIARNVREHRIGRLIEESQSGAEVSVFAADSDYGLVRKIRPDRLCERARTVVDLKTADDVSPGAFARACHRYGYHRGAAFYLDTLDLCAMTYEHYVFLVVANTPPFEVRAYTLDQDSIDQGRSEYRRLLREWSECEASGEWGRGPEEIMELRLPEYAITYHEEGMAA